jgi:hypothetical protein
MVGLLFVLLEKFSPRDVSMPVQQIALPVDEFECSRKLAHMVLFPHDDRIVALVGESVYVRWMDDQNIGAQSKSHGLRVLAEIGHSLRRMHLTANAQKSKILSLREARRHFHFDLNKILDEIQELPLDTKRNKHKVSSEVRKFWGKAKKYEGMGEWGKVLKRTYRIAGRAGCRTLRRRALKDILQEPTVAVRVLDYMRCTGNTAEYLDFLEKLWGAAEQIYSDVSRTSVESLLRVEPTLSERSRIRTLVRDLLQRKSGIVGAQDCAEVAPLLVLRFGDRRSLPLLKRVIDAESDRWPASVRRAAAVVYTSYGTGEFKVVRRLASRLLHNDLADVVRLVERIMEYEDVPDRYKARLKIRYDSVGHRRFVDMRGILAVRLLILSKNTPVKAWIANKKKQFHKEEISDFDKEILQKLL